MIFCFLLLLIICCIIDIWNIYWVFVCELSSWLCIRIPLLSLKSLFVFLGFSYFLVELLGQCSYHIVLMKKECILFSFSILIYLFTSIYIFISFLFYPFNIISTFYLWTWIFFPKNIAGFEKFKGLQQRLCNSCTILCFTVFPLWNKNSA